MFPHKNYDRFGKKDAKLRIGVINMQSFYDFIQNLNSMYAGSCMNNEFEQNFWQNVSLSFNFSEYKETCDLYK